MHLSVLVCIILCFVCSIKPIRNMWLWSNKKRYSTSPEHRLAITLSFKFTLHFLSHFDLYSVDLMKWLAFLPCSCHILYLTLLPDWMWNVFCYWKWDCCQIRQRPVPSAHCSLFIFQLNREEKANRLKIVKWPSPEPRNQS